MVQQQTIRLRIKGFNKPVEFDDCPEFAEGFRSILRGWNIMEEPVDRDIEPLIVFQKTPQGYDWRAPWIGRSQLERDEPPRSVMDAICDFHYEFIDWYVYEYPDHFCLHCAAVEIGDGLVVFPSAQKAGKSVLTMQLVYDGQRLFGDDVLAIRPDREVGVAFGMLPRVRLPLPTSNVSPDLHGFVADRPGPSDKYYQYVSLHDDELAPYGTQAKIAGIVLLERRDETPTILEAAGMGEVLKMLIGQNFATDKSPTEIFGQLKSIATGAKCFKLTYTDAREASEFLRDEFGS